MNLPRFEYLKPVSVEQCLTALQEPGKESRLLAGGTDLLVNMKYGVTRPERVVSIRFIPELCSVSEDREGNVRIGSCARLSDLVGNSLISEKLPSLHEAIRSVASVHIRNMATIGGNICLQNRCWYYNQSKLWRDALGLCHRTGGNMCHAIHGAKRCHAINNSDTVPALISLAANVCIVGKGEEEKVVPIKDFFRDDGIRHTILEPDEILTSVVIPKSSLTQPAIFIKESYRKGFEFATGSIGASIKGNGKRISEIVLVLNSLTSAPLRLKKAEQTIMDSGLKEEAILDAAEIARSELGTLSNLFTSAGYKRQLAGVLVKRALTGLKNQIMG